MSLIAVDSRTNNVFVQLEDHLAANHIVRLKTELFQIRRLVLRARTIRETSFARAGYTIAELFSGLVLFSLLLVQIENLSAALFITGSVSFLLLYMIALIRDLDNPFHYDHGHAQDEVGIENLLVVERRIRADFSSTNPPKP